MRTAEGDSELTTAKAGPDDAATISIFLADDNLIVREGVRALLALEADLTIVGTAADFEELIAGASDLAPQVVVTDIRMPPTFQQEGIEAAHEIRKRHPGTGVVILSQFDDPEYAISLLEEGAAGYAYLLKDRVAEGDQLARAVRTVAAGGSVLDPAIVKAMVDPVKDTGDFSAPEEELLRLVAEGRPIKAIAVAWRTTTTDAADAVEKLFLKLAQDASAGGQSSLRRLRMLHEAIVNREEQGETLSRFLPGGVAEMLLREGSSAGSTTQLTVSVLMSDIRGYSTIAEHADPSALARQLNLHRAEMNKAILDIEGTVMQFVGDAVMAVFGTPSRPRTMPSVQSRPPLPCTRPRSPSTIGGVRRASPCSSSASPLLPVRLPPRCSVRMSGWNIRLWGTR